MFYTKLTSPTRYEGAKWRRKHSIGLFNFDLPFTSLKLTKTPLKQWSNIVLLPPKGSQIISHQSIFSVSYYSYPVVFRDFEPKKKHKPIKVLKGFYLPVGSHPSWTGSSMKMWILLIWVAWFHGRHQRPCVGSNSIVWTWRLANQGHCKVMNECR